MKRTILLCILALACTAAGVQAETIYLKDGAIVRGKIVKEDTDSVMVEQDNAWQKIEKRAIELIKQDSEPPAAEASPKTVQPAAAPPVAISSSPQRSASKPAQQGRSGFFLGFQIPFNMIGGDFDGTTAPKVDPGIGFGLMLGYRFNPQFGLEVDWAGSSHNSEGGDIGFGEFSLNAKVSFATEERVRPFLFAGVGSFALGDSSLTFGGTGYNLGVGMDYVVNEENTIGVALVRKIITYDEVLKSDVPVVLIGDIKGDTTSIRFDLTHQF